MKKLYTIIAIALLGLSANAQCGGNPAPLVDFGFTNVCDGSVVSFNDLSTISSGNIQSFQWYFGDGSPFNASQNSSHLYTNAGSYNVKLVVISNLGCSDSITKSIVIYPNPVVNYTASPVMGCEPLCVGFMDSSYIATGFNAQWSWDFGDGGPTSNSQNPYNCYMNDSVYLPISYSSTLYVTSDNGCVSFLSKNNYITVDNFPCTGVVWPGDADNNTIVDNNDLLPLGLYFGQTGVSRSSIDNLWEADTAANWGTTQINGYDIKHADCNGNGTINANDTLAINLNFNLSHFITVSNVNYSERAGADLYIVTNGSLFNGGEWVDAEIWLGSSSNPINNLYGIAFNISYDASIVQSGTESITYPASWLGTPGTNAIKINKVDGTVNTAYGAITRIDHNNASGYGKIADFKFQIKTSLTSPVAIPLDISNYKANDASGAEQTFTTSLNEINKATGITVYPNPFSSQTNISFNEEQNHSIIKITDVLGKEVRIIDFSGKILSIEKGEMKDGIYFLQIVDGNKNLVNKKIIIQ